MNESIASTTASEQSHTVDFGSRLREARRAAGLDIVTLAARLRLHPKQIEALERCDLEALPGLIYVRGFLRGCARELKIDPQPLLEDLDRRSGVQTGALPAPTGVAFRRFHIGDGPKPIIVILLFVLVLAGLVGTLIPRRPPPPAQATAPQAQDAIPGQGQATPATGGAVEQLASPAPTAPTSSETPVPAPADATGSTSQSPQPPDSRLATQPTPPVLRPAAAAPGASAPAMTSAGKTAGTGEAGTASDSAELVLRIHSQAWIEVVQSDGTTLLSQICAPGTTQTIKGKEPLRVVIGNPSGVDAQFRGAAVDLTRYMTPNGVARLTLE